MRKFKLIKEYPGSPKLGTILTHEELQYCNWNEYYQEVIEKDYEVLSFITIESELIKYKDLDIDDDLNCDKYLKIYSVKRNDGEIFTIGDKVFTEYSNYTINKINIVNDKCMITALYNTNNPNGSRLHYNLNNLKKAKQPLFTTEDGVDIFEGDWYFRAATEGIVFDTISKYKASSKNAYPDNKYPDYHVNFSTKEAAEEYIIMNKPCLSINDILNHNVLTGKKVEHLEKLVQQKLNK